MRDSVHSNSDQIVAVDLLESRRKSLNKTSRSLQCGASRCNVLPASQRALVVANSGEFAMHCDGTVPCSPLQPLAMGYKASSDFQCSLIGSNHS